MSAEMSLLSTVNSYGLENTENNEKLFFYCHQLSASVENLKVSINRYENYKKNKKKVNPELEDDRT